jgi:hypothetical protein
MVSASAMSFDCPACGYPRGLHIPDCPNAAGSSATGSSSLRAVLTSSEVDPVGERRGLSMWVKLAGLLVVVGVVGWFAYRKWVLVDRWSDEPGESMGVGGLPTWQPSRPFLKPRYINPADAEEILDQVLDAEWLDP